MPDGNGSDGALDQLLGVAWTPTPFAWKVSKGRVQGEDVVFLQLETVIGRNMLVLGQDDAKQMADKIYEMSTGILRP